MGERRVELLWVPQKPSQFITWGSDIRVYRTLDCSEGRADNWEQIGQHRFAEEIQCLAELRRSIKCVDTNKGDTFQLAVGQNSGKVSLVNMNGSKNFGGEGSEYIPRQSHGCTSVSWHPTNHSYLAAGFDKLRSEHGVVIWDLSQGRQLSQPLNETANGDHCCSLAWVPTQANLLVTGLGVKAVKIFDTRSSGLKAVKQTLTKATYGLCVDPWSEYRICGFSEADPAIVIWDTRNFDKPIVTSSTQQQISRVSWCPTRRGLLANSYKDSGCIMLRDIMNWAVSQEDGEASVTERSIQPPTSIGNIIDFAWHPANNNTLLAMGTTVNQFCEWTVSDRLTLNWSARNGLVWSIGSRLETAVGEMPAGDGLDVGGQCLQAEVDDISVIMQYRAKLGYAGKLNVSNLKSFKFDTELNTVWSWILNSRSIYESSNQSTRFQGIRAILDQSQVASRVRQSTWTGVDNCKSVRTYYSPERDLVLKLCGWQQPLRKVVVPEEGKDESSASKALRMEYFMRNAAVAVFSLNMKNALDALKSGATYFNAKGDSVLANQLNMVSVAISGFSADTSKLWKDMVSSSLSMLPSPTLKSIFSFLACDDEAYKEVLNVNYLEFVDRMAVAHIFLSDNLLKEYLEKEWTNFLNTGRLEGVLISRSYKDSLSILQSFVDRTGDIQTACWTGIYILPPDYIKTDKIIEFVQNYRTMLDRWNMFAERSELDITLTNKDPSWDNMVQIYVACNFCGKSISNSGRNRMNKTGSLTRQATGQQNKNKAQACPSCRKPMPRCAICLVNMGTNSGLTPESKANIVTKFDEWFSWCQTCRHGGHAQHMLDWFFKHTMCPVTGCACKCGSLDPTSS